MGKWLKGAAAVLGLAVGGMLYGQSAAPETFQVKTPTYRTIDGILAQDIKSYINPLPRDKNIEFDLGPNAIYFSAIDPITVLKGKINYLRNDPRAKAFYASQADPWYLSIPGVPFILGKKKTNTSADENRLRDIRTYEQLLDVISKESRTPEYYKSLKQLSKSINGKDHVFTAKELEGILGGVTYAVDWKGMDSKGKSYNVPMLIVFPTEQAKPIIEGLIVPKQEPPKQNFPLPQLPEAPNPQSQTTAKIQTNQPLPIGLVLGADYSGSNNSVGVLVGPIFGYSNDPVNVAFTLGVSKGFSSESSTERGPVSNAGLWGKKTFDNSDFYSVNLGTSFSFGKKDLKAVVGGQIGFLNWTANSSSSTYLNNTLIDGPNSDPTEHKMAPDYTLFGGLRYKGFELDGGATFSSGNNGISAYLSSRIILGEPEKK